MLSVVITTWNEELNLPRVVSSVKKIAGEIIVVDTESTDKTVEIAKKLGCIVYTHKNTGIVEPVRNFSIAKAKGDWVLLLDADEEVNPELADIIVKTISSDKADYYRLPRKNIIFNHWTKNSHWWPDYVYRLFKKGYISWGDEIHSIPVTRGRGADFPIDESRAITHHHYQTISQYILRIDRYTEHQLNLLVRDKTQFTWQQLIIKPSQEFIRQFFAREGFRDGVHGLALAGLQAVSELVLYLKLWQLTDFKQEFIPIREFNKQTLLQFKDFRWWLYQHQGITGKILRKIKMWFI
jgi:glycosyltransferase involved in cell wall biosynthesis